MMNNSGKYLIWTLLSVIGAFALGYIALNRGEQINALWIVVAAVCVYLIAYRFYGLYIAKMYWRSTPRMTPAGASQRRPRLRSDRQKVLFATILRPLPARGRWSARCWRRKWATCRE